MTPLCTQDFESFRPEFRLVLALCRGASDSLSDETVEQLVQYGLDWEEVLRIGSVQRVLPLMWRQLRQRNIERILPRAASEGLRWAAEASARHNLYLSKVLLQILAGLRDSGITVVPFKGPALAARVYGDLGLRQSSDLDLLVRTCDFSATIAALAELGFQPALELSARQYRLMLTRECELSLTGEGGVCVDLHWNVVARYFCVPITIDPFWLRLVEVKLAGVCVQDLAPEDLLISLVLHARRHYWAKLIWICDIARLILNTPQMNWPVVIDQCRNLRALRILQLSLYLCQRLFGTLLPDEVRAQANDNKVVENLAAWSMCNLEGGLESDNSGLRNYLVSLRTRECWSDRIAQVLLHAFTPGVAEWHDCSNPPWMDIPLHLSRIGQKAYVGLRRGLG